MARDYKKEYQQDLKTGKSGPDSDQHERGQRVKARRMLEKEGAVSKGDGKDVDHKNPLRSGGTTTRSNLRVRSVKSNRGDTR
jgi:hypothetical protein